MTKCQKVNQIACYIVLILVWQGGIGFLSTWEVGQVLWPIKSDSRILFRIQRTRRHINICKCDSTQVIKSNLPYLEPGVTYPIIRVNIHCLAASDARDTFSSSSFPNLAPWSPLLTSSQSVIEQKSSLILSMMSRSSPTLPAPIIFVPARTTFDREEVTLQAGAQRQSCKNQGVHFMSAATPS